MVDGQVPLIFLFDSYCSFVTGEEETRRASPLLTEDEWNDVLRKTGFTGVDVAIWDTPDEVAHHGSNMIARASVDTKDAYPTNVTVVAEGDASSRVQAVLSEEMSKYVQTTNTATLSSLDLKGSVCIVLNELDSSVLRDPSCNNYESVRRIFSETDGVIWVTRGATQSTHPDASLVTGLTRTVTSEAGSVVIVTLDLDGSIPIEESKVAKLILDVFRKNFMVDARVGLELDAEYIERGGKLMVPRVMEDTKLSNFVASRSGVRIPEDQPFYQPGRALRLEIGTPGLLDTLHFVDDTRTLERLPEDHVEIEVKASGVNFRDVMMSMGQIDVQRLGGECCGVVSAVGSAVSRLRVGDRVVAFVDGSFANYARWPASGVEKIPDDMPFEVGATLPIVYCTAYHSIKVASLSQGETVLIHAASGGLGQALIMLCQNIGAEIFATVGTPEKNEFLRKQYGIPEDHIFSSRDETFASGIMRMTNDKGVDVIFNSVSGDMLRRTFECIAPFGRFIELGKKDFAVNTRLEMRSFARNVTFAAVDLVTLLAEKPKYGSDMWAQVMSLVRTGVVKPPQPITVFSMGEVEKALRTMQIGRHIGKLVIVPQPSEIVKVCSTASMRRTVLNGFGILGHAATGKSDVAENRCFLFTCWWSGRTRKSNRLVDGASRSKSHHFCLPIRSSKARSKRYHPRYRRTRCSCFRLQLRCQ
jgi:NADPH:quinone reductase-like Zn-dependent oxidoreductase